MDAEMMGSSFPFLLHAARATRQVILLASIVGLVAVACSSVPFTMDATGLFAYPSVVNPTLQEVAILITVTNRSGDDLQVNPTDFVARDVNHHIYLTNPTATSPDARSAGMPLKMATSLPLPTVTLRNDDVLSGFVVFDVPSGARLAEVIWRQSDKDYVVNLPAAP